MQVLIFPLLFLICNNEKSEEQLKNIFYMIDIKQSIGNPDKYTQ